MSICLPITTRLGDTFTATLEQPLVVDGFVVAPRGSTVMGRVTEAKKAGRVEGTSRLGVELTGLTLIDGQQVSIQSQMINHNGPTSVGRDAAAIGGTTALGAAIGAGADWGRGAAIGAGAGAAAGIIGVLLTRGHPTVIGPESAMTFQITAPVTFSTEHAPQAFQYVSTQQQYVTQQRQPRAVPHSSTAARALLRIWLWLPVSLRVWLPLSVLWRFRSRSSYRPTLRLLRRLSWLLPPLRISRSKKGPPSCGPFFASKARKGSAPSPAPDIAGEAPNCSTINSSSVRDFSHHPPNVRQKR